MRIHAASPQVEVDWNVKVAREQGKSSALQAALQAAEGRAEAAERRAQEATEALLRATTAATAASQRSQQQAAAAADDQQARRPSGLIKLPGPKGAKRLPPAVLAAGIAADSRHHPLQLASTADDADDDCRDQQQAAAGSAAGVKAKLGAVKGAGSNDASDVGECSGSAEPLRCGPMLCGMLGPWRRAC